MFRGHQGFSLLFLLAREFCEVCLHRAAMYFYEIQHAASDACLIAGSSVTIAVGVASVRPPGTAIKDFYLLYEWSLLWML